MRHPPKIPFLQQRMHFFSSSPAAHSSLQLLPAACHRHPTVPFRHGSPGRRHPAPPHPHLCILTELRSSPSPPLCMRHPPLSQPTSLPWKTGQPWLGRAGHAPRVAGGAAATGRAALGAAGRPWRGCGGAAAARRSGHGGGGYGASLPPPRCRGEAPTTAAAFPSSVPSLVPPRRSAAGPHGRRAAERASSRQAHGRRAGNRAGGRRASPRACAGRDPPRLARLPAPRLAADAPRRVGGRTSPCRGPTTAEAARGEAVEGAVLIAVAVWARQDSSGGGGGGRASDAASGAEWDGGRDDVGAARRPHAARRRWRRRPPCPPLGAPAIWVVSFEDAVLRSR